MNSDFIARMGADFGLEQRGILTCYEHLAHLSDLMLSAARSANWEQVGELEQKAGRVVEELKMLQDESADGSPFRQEKMRLIRLIIALDADIRDLAQPRLVQLEKAMHAPRVTRRLSAAYGAGRFD